MLEIRNNNKLGNTFFMDNSGHICEIQNLLFHNLSIDNVSKLKNKRSQTFYLGSYKIQ